MDVVDFKDKHKGQRCFVIGNGPSLTPEILDKLRNEYTIAVNRIGKIFNRTDWRPTYYVGITTALNDARHKKDIIAAIKSAQVAFCWDYYNSEETVGKLTNVVYLPCSNVDYKKPPEEAKDSFWSDDIGKRLDKFGVAVFSALQVAAYMGFDLIYLIGCDGGYTRPVDGKDYSHFDKAYRPFDACNQYNYDELNRALLRAHEIAQAAADRRGFKIVNLSPISQITAHEKANLEDVL